MDQSKFDTIVFNNTNISKLIQTTYELIINKNTQLMNELEDSSPGEDAKIAEKLMTAEITGKLHDATLKNHDNLIKLLGVIQKIAAPTNSKEATEDTQIKDELQALKDELLKDFPDLIS